jgi:hypothetical protein
MWGDVLGSNTLKFLENYFLEIGHIFFKELMASLEQTPN